jgi:hypothetical protein
MPKTEYALIPETTTGQDVTRAATQALRRFKHDREKALAALTLQVKGNSALRQAAVELGLRHAIMTASTENRRQLFVAASGEDSEESHIDPQAATRAAAIPFLDSYALYGGQVLGDATAAEVRASAVARRAQASTQIKRASFEDSVAKAVKGGKTVRESMRDAFVASLAAAHKVRA